MQVCNDIYGTANSVPHKTRKVVRSIMNAKNEQKQEDLQRALRQMRSIKMAIGRFDDTEISEDDFLIAFDSGHKGSKRARVERRGIMAVKRVYRNDPEGESIMVNNELRIEELKEKISRGKNTIRILEEKIEQKKKELEENRRKIEINLQAMEAMKGE